MSDALSLENGKSLQSATNDWYRIIQRLGSGGNAVTYLVVATSGTNKGILFALKIFRRLSKPERKESFRREVEYLKQQKHPAIMRTFDEGLFRYRVDGQENEYPFVVAEYLPQTLYHIIRASNTSQAERINIAVQLISALAFLEKSSPQAVHRDIKPQNIFVKGRACVLGDFGLMKLLDESDEVDRPVFKESTGPGMPFLYRTPDLVAYAKNESALTVKTDVFQLGLVLAELFTGRNPAKRPPPDDLLVPVELFPIGFCPGRFGPLIFQYLNQMLTQDPAQRPTASQLMDKWLGLFTNVCEEMHNIEGRVF
ncbi:protein kinase [Corallococcus sp. BB11-1]|uniref:serine/threonine protein kinase n=1 Tax=Corallococcus sp. BB11-1 TaxID=2996783 RepID=UPI00226EB408|nr:protein kinase [Corallococcus sp. BB11-1]MCY1036166.1 protein kinase [Corallococcus sp. BB11-1]